MCEQREFVRKIEAVIERNIVCDRLEKYMKGLLKYLSPFAPDQSGACSVLYELGGILVIADAGGCTGNICGFDEPRWFRKKSAIFSAGLRDMDAILGRDDKLIEKLKDVSEKMDATFAGIIGTPVPAVIATDFRALKRMAEKRCGIPVLTVECTGTRLYDEGASDAYMELIRTFAGDGSQSEAKMVAGVGSQAEEKMIGILGVTPLDTSLTDASLRLESIFQAEGYNQVNTFSTVEQLRSIRSTEKNLVIAPSGLKAARELEKRFGTPYEIGYPLLENDFLQKLQKFVDNIKKMKKTPKVLIVHQQIAAEEIRRRLAEMDVNNATVASWFMMDAEWRQDQDIHLETEEELVKLVEQGEFDGIIGDSLLKRPLKGYDGEWLDFVHFAVSGKLKDEE